MRYTAGARSQPPFCVAYFSGLQQTGAVFGAVNSHSVLIRRPENDLLQTGPPVKWLTCASVRGARSEYAASNQTWRLWQAPSTPAVISLIGGAKASNRRYKIGRDECLDIKAPVDLDLR